MNSCKCGCGLPVGKAGTYLNSAHKQRAYRSRKRNQNRALSRAVYSKAVEIMGKKKAEEAFEYLNRIQTDKYNVELDKGLLIMLMWFESKAVKVNQNA